jgi:transcriptional regulator with XRE-family HTH domain
MQTLASRIRRYRKLAKLSQTELATFVGVSQTAITLLETGARTKPRAVTLLKMAEALGVSVTDLMGKSEADLMGEARTEKVGSREELRLLAAFRALSSQQRTVAFRLIKALK